LDTFIRECPPGIQLLDIGAHYGFFALAAVHYGGPSARVLCVEASPNAASILNSTIALNPGKDQIEVFNVAMGDRDGTLPMLATGPIAGDYFVVPTEERSDTTLVPQRSLASLLKETRFKPTHIKIDIEGFEFEVVESSIATLKEIRPVLFFELHGDALRARGKDPSAVIGMLQSAGYNRFEMAGHPIQLEEMKAAAFNCRMTCISSS
jgi:FkbM family methyltransferase